MAKKPCEIIKDAEKLKVKFDSATFKVKGTEAPLKGMVTKKKRK